MAPLINDPTTWTEWGVVDKELEALLKSDSNPAFQKTPEIGAIVATRNAWAPKYKAVVDTVLAANENITAEEIQIPRRDGESQRAIVYRPEKISKEGHPLLVLIHGGGFCYGCPEMEGPTCIKAVKAYNCVAVSLSYRLAPENKFPCATDDCWDALQWITRNLSVLHADPKKGIVLGGTSAGGNIAIVLSHQARDTGLQPPLTGLYLNVPLVLSPEAVPDQYRSFYQSRQQNRLAPVLNEAFMDMYTKAYAADVMSPIWSPINWPGERSHAGMPRTYFQICGLDVLRDEGLIYERVLRQDYGVETRVDIYPGVPHMFVPNFPTLKQSAKYPVDTLAGIGWLFRQ